HLRTLPTRGPQILVGPGEDAGVVDLGGGVACVFKLESHSHPSAIEPFQGAATGVGGIVRDVLSMGARPVALLDPLRFGPLEDAHNRYLVSGVVAAPVCPAPGPSRRRGPGWAPRWSWTPFPSGSRGWSRSRSSRPSRRNECWPWWPRRTSRRPSRCAGGGVSPRWRRGGWKRAG